MSKQIEVQGTEIAIRNSFGDIAIIPIDKVEEVQELIDEGCWNCVDKIVNKLPTLKSADKAEAGGVEKQEWPEPIAPKIGSSAYDVKDRLNPLNILVPDYTKEGTFDQAFSKARKEGNKEFIYGNKKFRANKDTDPLKSITNEFDSEKYRKDNPEFNKLANKGSDFNIERTKDRGFYRTNFTNSKKTINIGREYATHRLNDSFNAFVDEMAHHKDIQSRSILDRIGLLSKLDYERNIGGENELQYYKPDNEEWKTHRYYANALGLVELGNLSPEDIKKIQKHVGVKEDGYLWEDTYKAIVEKYKKDNTSQAIDLFTSHQIEEKISKQLTEDELYLNKKYPLYTPDVSMVYLQAIASDVPIKGLADRLNSKHKYSKISMGLSYNSDVLLNTDPKELDIKMVQNTLQRVGYELPKSTISDFDSDNFGEFDGIWGEETEAALNDFKNKRGLGKLSMKVTKEDRFVPAKNPIPKFEKGGVVKKQEPIPDGFFEKAKAFILPNLKKKSQPDPNVQERPKFLINDFANMDPKDYPKDEPESMRMIREDIKKIEDQYFWKMQNIDEEKEDQELAYMDYLRTELQKKQDEYDNHKDNPTIKIEKNKKDIPWQKVTALTDR